MLTLRRPRSTSRTESGKNGSLFSTATEMSGEEVRPKLVSQPMSSPKLPVTGRGTSSKRVSTVLDAVAAVIVTVRACRPGGGV